MIYEKSLLLKSFCKKCFLFQGVDNYFKTVVTNDLITRIPAIT